MSFSSDSESSTSSCRSLSLTDILADSGPDSGPEDSFDFSSGLLAPHEKFWVKYQPFLLMRGFKLRPRFDPNWVPSWMQGDNPPEKKDCPDAIANADLLIMDAVRLVDNKQVIIKLMETDTAEMPIGRYLSSLSDPRNASVPILNILLCPLQDGIAFIIMPMLLFFEHLPFRRLGEFSEAFEQFLEGLELMHEHNVAHRDACRYNLMMDISKVIPGGYMYERWQTRDGFEPITSRDRWDVRPVKYYFIDFELSTRYPAGQIGILDVGVLGQDRSVPESSNTVPYDPFKMDIYQLGNAFLNIIDLYEGLEPFRPLCTAMTRQSPDTRPSAAEAVKELKALTTSFSLPDLEQRIWRRSTEIFYRDLIEKGVDDDTMFF